MTSGPAVRAAATVLAMLAVGAGAHAAWPGKNRPTKVVAATSPAAVAGIEERAEAPAPDHVVGPLDVGSLLPADPTKDSPGTDSRNLPRPSDSLRVFVSSLDAQGSMLRVYKSKRSVADLEKELGQATLARGYRQVDSGETGTLTFKRGTDLAIIRIIPSERGDEAYASLIEMPFKTPSHGGEQR